MKSYKKLAVMAAVILSLAFAGQAALAQQEAGKAAPGAAVAKAPTMTIKGKIQYMKNLGGYFLMGEEPRHEFMISNQDRTLLRKLRKSGKTVTVEAQTTKQADRIIIESIDGKKYAGK